MGATEVSSGSPFMKAEEANTDGRDSPSYSCGSRLPETSLVIKRFPVPSSRTGLHI